MFQVTLMFLLTCIVHCSPVDSKSGKCESISKEECLKMAKSRGIRGVATKQSNTPSGCYYKTPRRRVGRVLIDQACFTSMQQPLKPPVQWVEIVFVRQSMVSGIH